MSLVLDSLSKGLLCSTVKRDNKNLRTGVFVLKYHVYLYFRRSEFSFFPFVNVLCGSTCVSGVGPAQVELSRHLGLRHARFDTERCCTFDVWRFYSQKLSIMDPACGFEINSTKHLRATSLLKKQFVQHVEKVTLNIQFFFFFQRFSSGRASICPKWTPPTTGSSVRASIPCAGEGVPFPWRR